MNYRTPTDKADSSRMIAEAPKIVVSMPSNMIFTPDDKIAILPRKYKMISLNEVIKMPKLNKETVLNSGLNDSGDKKALSASKLENIISAESSQEAKEGTEPKSGLASKKRKAGSLASSPIKKDSFKKTKLTVNRQKVLNDIQKLLKEEKELEKEIFAKKNEDSSEKDQKLEAKIEELDELSTKWKDVSQNALYELHKHMGQNFGSEVTLSRIILELSIKSDRLDFNAELEDFET